MTIARSLFLAGVFGASLPLAAAVRAETDAGRPTVASAPGSAAGEAFVAAARALRAVVEEGEGDGDTAPTISITDD